MITTLTKRVFFANIDGMILSVKSNFSHKLSKGTVKIRLVHIVTLCLETTQPNSIFTVFDKF